MNERIHPSSDLYKAAYSGREMSTFHFLVDNLSSMICF